MATILIVEDDPLIARIYKTRLTADGYTVEVCINGEDALTKLVQVTPDLILLDIMMPKMDGLTALTKIREMPKTQKTPVLIYSNLSNEAEIQRARQIGATEFLIKANLTPTEVVEKIKQYLPK